MTLLKVEDLAVEFTGPEGPARAVDGVSFHLDSGETLGLVGESGCGKTVTAMSILRLIPSPPGRIVSGRVIFQERDLLALGDDEMRRVRGRLVAMIFQEPMTSLNPVFTVGDQIAEAVRLHQGLDKRSALEAAAEALREVGIPDPGRRLSAYPHQLSGGMRQRVMIAMAISCRPELLIADEPTTALDVTIQAQILDLLRGLKEKRGLSMLLITHNLGVVRQAAGRAAVMYLGQIVEEAPAPELLAQPLHPYSQGLLASVPDPDRPDQRLSTIPGLVPSIHERPAGCRFAARCPRRFDACQHPPELKTTTEGRRVRCHLYA